MDETMLRRVNASLNTKFYTTNDVWLRDCVEYYMSEHDNPTHAEVLEFVISQWQLSDLREISNERPSLPNNLAQEKCTILRGHFVLQLEKLYDIAESKYKQLEKIRNVSTDNIQATESEKTQAWEPKKKRMLHLHLTDGAQNVTAIEYRPIRFLHPNILPGYKLMIKGPVTCRRGIILLDETNVSEIGGEVENLLVPNALENILARALNLEENPDPYSDNIQARTTEDAVFDNDFEEIPDPCSDNVHATVTENAVFDNDFGEIPDPFSDNVKAKAPEIVLFDDDFDVDMEDVALIEVENMEKSPSVSSRDRSNDANSARVPKEPASRRIEAVREIDRPPPAPLNQRTESDMLFDTIDDKIFETVPDSLPNVANDSSTSSKVPKRFVPRGSSSVADRPNNSNHVANEPKTSGSRIVEEPSAPVENPSLATYMELCEESSFETKKPIFGRSADAPISNVDKAKTRETLPTKQTSNFATKLPNRHEAKETIQTGSKRSAVVLSSPMPNPPAEKVRCTQMTPKAVKTNRKITDYMKKDDPPEASTSTAKTYERICDLVRAVHMKTADQCKVVKASVTDMDKLSRNGQCWELTATITDRTGSIDVAVSSEILSRLLGFTVPEFSQKKKLKKNNPEIEKQLRLGFRSAESKLTNLCALLRVELAPDQKPKIVEIIEDSGGQKKTL